MNNPSNSYSAKQAVVRFTLLEAPALVLFVAVIAYLFVLDNGLSGQDVIFWMLVSAGVFVIYIAFLFVTVLMPVFGGGRNAR